MVISTILTTSTRETLDETLLPTTILLINGQETYSDLLDIIKNQRIVIERLQHQIDRMQDQMEEYQSQFTKVQEIKEKLMDMLLEDREMLKLKIFGKLTDN